jgi:hypothetical protein
MAGKYGDAFGPYADGDIRSVQLIATAALSAVSFWSEGYKNWIQSNQWMMWVSVWHFPTLLCTGSDFIAAFRLDRIHAPDLLEAQVLSHEPPLSRWLHRPRSLRYICHCLLLSDQDCTSSSASHRRNFCRSHSLCLPNEVRLYLLDAILIWWTLGFDPFRLHGSILSIQQHC